MLHKRQKLPLPRSRTTTVTLRASDMLGRGARERCAGLPGSPRSGHSFASVGTSDPKESLPRRGEEPPVKVGAPPQPFPPNPATPAGTQCEKPNSMRAVISGPFLDGLTMDNYYPGLRSQGFFANPDRAGPWDTGKRCGVNVQLVGSLHLLCRDDLFQFTQTVHHEKSIFGGKKDADDGTTHDDIAESGGDYTKPPLKQSSAPDPMSGEGSDVAHISMADPPSLEYARAPDVEWDRSFVTALTGPKGKAEVRWRVSMVVKNGEVLKNTVG